jgi:hypothetical protein
VTTISRTITLFLKTRVPFRNLQWQAISAYTALSSASLLPLSESFGDQGGSFADRMPLSSKLASKLPCGNTYSTTLRDGPWRARLGHHPHVLGEISLKLHQATLRSHASAESCSHHHGTDYELHEPIVTFRIFYGSFSEFTGKTTT